MRRPIATSMVLALAAGCASLRTPPPAPGPPAADAAPAALAPEAAAPPGARAASPDIPPIDRPSADTVEGEPFAADYLGLFNALTGEFTPAPAEWVGSTEFGLNGAEGNSQNLNVLFLADSTRKTEFSTTDFNALYTYAAADSVRTQNRLLTKARRERPFAGSAFSMFTNTELLLDEFTAYDVRLAGHFGGSYQWIDTDVTKFKTRFGAGASREFGGPENATFPEFLFGGNLDRKINDRWKFTSSVDYFPEVNDFADFRLEARAAVEVVIDPEWNLALKFGVLDRYDSTPEGAKANDLEYFATLKWSFGPKAKK